MWQPCGALTTATAALKFLQSGRGSRRHLPPLSHSTQQFPSPQDYAPLRAACPACGKEEDKIRRWERSPPPSIALIQKWGLAKEEEASPGKRGKEGGGIKKRFAPLPPPPSYPSFPSGVAGERGEEEEEDRKEGGTPRECVQAARIGGIGWQGIRQQMQHCLNSFLTTRAHTAAGPVNIFYISANPTYCWRERIGEEGGAG